MRKVNKADMTIHEQLEFMAEKMCSDYCKYPAIYHERLLRDEYEDADKADEAMQNENCTKCPLMEL